MKHKCFKILLVLSLLMVLLLASVEADKVSATGAMRPGFDTYGFAANDDGSIGWIPLGFSANFLGTTYS